MIKDVPDFSITVSLVNMSHTVQACIEFGQHGGRSIFGVDYKHIIDYYITKSPNVRLCLTTDMGRQFVLEAG